MVSMGVNQMMVVLMIGVIMMTMSSRPLGDTVLEGGVLRTLELGHLVFLMPLLLELWVLHVLDDF